MIIKRRPLARRLHRPMLAMAFLLAVVGGVAQAQIDTGEASGRYASAVRLRGDGQPPGFDSLVIGKSYPSDAWALFGATTLPHLNTSDPPILGFDGSRYGLKSIQLICRPDGVIDQIGLESAGAETRNEITTLLRLPAPTDLRSGSGQNAAIVYEDRGITLISQGMFITWIWLGDVGTVAPMGPAKLPQSLHMQRIWFEHNYRDPSVADYPYLRVFGHLEATDLQDREMSFTMRLQDREGQPIKGNRGAPDWLVDSDRNVVFSGADKVLYPNSRWNQMRFEIPYHHLELPAGHGEPIDAVMEVRCDRYRSRAQVRLPMPPEQGNTPLAQLELANVRTRIVQAPAPSPGSAWSAGGTGLPHEVSMDDAIEMALQCNVMGLPSPATARLTLRHEDGRPVFGGPGVLGHQLNAKGEVEIVQAVDGPLVLLTIPLSALEAPRDGSAAVIATVELRGEGMHAFRQQRIEIPDQERADIRQIRAALLDLLDAVARGDAERAGSLCTGDLAEEMAGLTPRAGQPPDIINKTGRVEVHGMHAIATALITAPDAPGLERQMFVRTVLSKREAAWRVQSIEFQPYLPELHAEELMQ